MAMLSDMYDKNENLLCRYCRFSSKKKDKLWHCRKSQDPGCDHVDPDIAECVLGEIAPEKEHWQRQHADDQGILYR